MPSLQLENGIVLVKQNKVEEGIYKIFFCEFPEKMKIIKRLIRTLPTFEIVYLTLKYIITNYSKNPQKLNKLLNNTEELAVEFIIIDILEEVKTEYYLIYQLSCLDLFDCLVLDKFLNFFVQTLSNLDSDSKSLKIESSLIESKVISAYNLLFEHQKEKVIVDNRSSCSKCNKGFFNCQLVYQHPKILYHIECYNAMDLESNLNL